MSDFSPESKALFGAARAGLEPTPGDRARIERALGARLGVALVTATATASVSATAGAAGAAAGAASTLGVVAKWIGVGLLVGVGAASGYAVVKGVASPSKVPAPVTSAALPGLVSSVQAPPGGVPPGDVTSPLLAAPGSAPVAAPAEVREKSVAVPSLAPVEQQPPGHVGEEAALLRKADEALRGGDAYRALALLREHALHFPGGILTEERSAELVTTLCRLGRVAEARREAEQFLRANPDSPLAPSVRSSCAGLGGAPAR